jgi:hypothetical protein
LESHKIKTLAAHAPAAPLAPVRVLAAPLALARAPALLAAPAHSAARRVPMGPLVVLAERL